MMDGQPLYDTLWWDEPEIYGDDGCLAVWRLRLMMPSKSNN